MVDDVTSYHAPLNEREDETAKKIAALESKIVVLETVLNKISELLRGPIHQSSLNEMIYVINGFLSKDEHVTQVAWGVSSTVRLQKKVKELCEMVALPEYQAYLDKQIKTGIDPSTSDVPLKRQHPGGFIIPEETNRFKSATGKK